MNSSISITAKLANLLNDIEVAKVIDTKTGFNELLPMLNGYKSETIKAELAGMVKARTRKAVQAHLMAMILELSVIQAQPAFEEETEIEEEMCNDADINHLFGNDKAIEIEPVKLKAFDRAKESLKPVKVDLAPVIKEVIEEVKEEKIQELIEAQLKDLAFNIRCSIDNVQHATFALGRDLTTVHGILKDQGKKQSDFFEWVDKNCSIKKAQAYKLMSVYKNFGDESDFHKVSMRVLYTLTRQPEKIIELARPLAIEGKLDSCTLKEIMDKEEKKDVPKVDSSSLAPAPKEIIIDQNGNLCNDEYDLDSEGRIIYPEDNEQELDSDYIPSETFQAAPVKVKGKEFDTGIPTESNQPIKAIETPVDGKDQTIETLNKIIMELNQMVRDLRDELAKATDKSCVVSAKYLPQFDSKSMITVLGIEPENANDIVKIKRAYRALAGIYTATTCPAGSEKIKIARDTLLEGRF